MTQAQRQRLFAVFYLCRFGRAVALDLCERAARINRIVALLNLGCIAGSLLTGSIAYFGSDILKPYWAGLSVLAVVVALWAAIQSYSEKEFDSHQLASRFEQLALSVENFSSYAVHNEGIAARDIDSKATAFHADYSQIMGSTRREYKLYADRHSARIDHELRRQMQAAGFVNDEIAEKR
jgi:hypothetical protein